MTPTWQLVVLVVAACLLIGFLAGVGERRDRREDQ